MNYTELKTNIEDICENSFTDDQLAMFTEQAEQKIYNTVQIPALRKNVTGTLTASNKYLSSPSDFLYSYSLAVVDGSGVYHYLLNKDVNFMREAYPNPTSEGLPKHLFSFIALSLILSTVRSNSSRSNFELISKPSSNFKTSEVGKPKEARRESTPSKPNPLSQG